MGIIPSEQLTLYSSGVKKLDASVFSLLMLFDNDRDDLTTSEEVIDAIASKRMGCYPQTS